MFSNKIIVVTGGTGSFGSAFVNHMLKADVGEIRVFSRDENKQDNMLNSLKNSKVKFYLGDVRNIDSVNKVMKGANYVFHAAALKQVPSCEFYPMGAVQTNILGADNVLKSATDNNLEKVVLLSTDKAVYPINAMGLSKAMMEKIMLSQDRSLGDKKTILCATRYGNVMVSRGSVIPLFIKQILGGVPITITNPHMTRFLMSLEESVDLVLYALKNAKQGDIFVQKAPAYTIQDLLTALKELFKSNAKVQCIGTRHGEKLYESLISSEDMLTAQNLKEYYRIPLDNRDLNYTKYYNKGNVNIDNVNGYNSHNAVQLDVEAIKKLFLKLPFVQEALLNA